MEARLVDKPGNKSKDKLRGILRVKLEVNWGVSLKISQELILGIS